MNENVTITDAVRDQFGRMYFRVGSGDPASWIAGSDLCGNANAAFARLQRQGINIMTAQSRKHLQEQAEAITEFRSAIVADRPGWAGRAYIFPDGEICFPHRGREEVIVAFEPDWRFTPSGHSLQEWQQAIGPFVEGQTIPLVVLGLSLVGPMLRFAPSHFINPIVELVGPRHCGKSTMGALAASSWGGDPNNANGCACTWDFTPRAIDPIKASHADSLLVLDETSLQPSKEAEQARVAHDAVSRLASHSQRTRYGEPADTSSVRLAALSTSNVDLESLVKGHQAARDALLSRVVTIDLNDRRFGVFDDLPPGYASTRLAIEALQCVIAKNYGVVARSFVDKLVKRQDTFTPSLILMGLERSLRDLQGIGAPRHEKSLALVMVALSLARDFGIFPRAWGNPRDVVLSVASLLQDRETGNREAVERVSAYIAEHSGSFIREGDTRCPLSSDDYKTKAGFWLDSPEVLVPTDRLQAALPNCQADMRCLRSLGIAKTEGGKQPKLCIKAPRWITAGRGYCINVIALERYRAVPTRSTAACHPQRCTTTRHQSARQSPGAPASLSDARLLRRRSQSSN